MRSNLYHSLIAELLGPRNGAEETFPHDIDPRDEYITGILEPQDLISSPVNDISKSDITANISDEESEEDASDISDDFDMRSTVLGPRSFPKSMGISFIVKSPDDFPKLSFCITWGRYSSKGKGIPWKRNPHKFTVMHQDVSTDRSWNPKEKEARIVMRTVKLKDDRYHVSLFLVNNVQSNGRTATEDLIFQPQIRIKLSPNVILESLDEVGSYEPDYKKTMLSYRDFPTLARGHLCGACWKDIDFLLLKEHANNQHQYSTDIILLTEEERNLFLFPDLRTDYLPTYISRQSSPSLGEMGMEEGDTRADQISETRSEEKFAFPLRKICAAYSKWIDGQEKIADSISGEYRSAAHEIIDESKLCLRRMNDGVELLLGNDDARLAFCFMNKAMDMQSVWGRKKHLTWRPFQIAFILQCIRGIIDESHSDRQICDLLWFPTGGGKTEAYLGLLIFTILYRRRKLLKSGIKHSFGTSAISRYTLRLLTIQQFRRTLNAITACEYLRVKNWLPQYLKNDSQGLWGDSRFSIGLWVGGEVTPNNLVDHMGFDKTTKIRTRNVGAVGILTYKHKDYNPGEKIEFQGEPAQVSSCPCCSAVLAIASEGVPAQNQVVFLTFTADDKPSDILKDPGYSEVFIHKIRIHNLPMRKYFVAEVEFSSLTGDITDIKINNWWRKIFASVLKIKTTSLVCAQASRPGYFIKKLNDVNRSPYDFEIRCPNPNCELNAVTSEESIPGDGANVSSLPIIEPFQLPSNPSKSRGVPIPAFTVDAQIYAWCPSIIIATVDKFARLAFEPKASSIFGNVNVFDTHWGYYRMENPPDTGSAKLAKGIEVKSLYPPDLILQDELHLIDGPLGSLVGLYECIIDVLTSRKAGNQNIKAKYIASTATIHEANSQTRSLYNRDVKQFPPLGLSIGDNFFTQISEGSLDDDGPGRLYVGVCAPGKGPQTPTVRIWARLLQECQNVIERSNRSLAEELDYYWTIVGYFNAIKELAQAVSLYRQDIPERIKNLTDPFRKRDISITSYLELSSNINSLRLPLILNQLSNPSRDIDAVMATSMFGTGVDIDRLSVMVVHGQPKTTSSYIQATGRVGRQMGALVVTFLRSTRPRDLAHYEFFTGYHRTIHRQVEPVTVAPFSPRACQRALGPVFVSILRNGRSINNVSIPPYWSPDNFKRSSPDASGSRKMSTCRTASEIEQIVTFLEERGQNQPPGRRREKLWVRTLLSSGLDLWRHIALTGDVPLFYYEASINYRPEHSVVLGDAAHKKYGLRQVFEKVPTSLRDIEPTARFG